LHANKGGNSGGSGWGAQYTNIGNGGGSFNSGKYQVNEADANAGHGYVEIEAGNCALFKFHSQSASIDS
jgi:hypothetical protein